MRHPRNGGRSIVCISNILPGELTGKEINSMSTCSQVPPQENCCSTSSFGCIFHSSNLRSSNHHDEDDDCDRNFRPKIEQQRSSVCVIRTKPWISSRSSDPTTSCTLAQVQKEFWHFSGGGGDLLQGQWKNLAMAVVHKYKGCGDPILKGECNFRQG